MKPDGRTSRQILGVAPERARPADLEKLSKSDLLQLFMISPAPALEDLHGEMSARTLKVGVMAMGVELFTHNVFGPAHWVGKAYRAGKQKGLGYNLFQDENGVYRTRKMSTFVGTSNIDGRVSYHLDYSPHNGGLIHSMHDELRKINDTLYLGMGYMALGGGSINPAPFLIYGKARPWVGTDRP